MHIICTGNTLRKIMRQGAVVHTLSPSVLEAEAGRALGAGDKPRLHRESQDNKGYTVRPV